MKKPIILMLLAIALIMQSCKKDQSHDSVSALKELSALTQEVIAKPTLQELKQGQGFLSSSERSKLWETKLNFILNNSREKFTADQRSIIFSLQKFLTQHGMAKLLANSKLGVDFLNQNLTYWNKNFSKAQLNILIESPYIREDFLLSKFSDEQMMSMVGVSERAAAAGGHCTCIYDGGCS